MRLAVPTSLLAFVLTAGTLLAGHAAFGQAVTDDWSSVKMPDTPPPLEAASVDPTSTALLVMDFLSANCSDQRPRCIAALPHVQKLVGEARAHKMLIVYTTFPGQTRANILPVVGAQASDPVISANADKFTTPDNDLQKLLTDHGIKTVIATGTAANGAELYTVSEAALRGFKAVVPVDAMPGATPLAEAVTLYQFTNFGSISSATTLTKSDMIGFGN